MTVVTIASKIKTYFENNEQAKKIKKILDPLNTEIKAYFSTAEEKIMIVDDIEAKVAARTSENMNSAKLLAKLKKLKRKDLIKKVEMPDMEKIEKLIYDQELDATLLADCVETTTTYALTVARIKTKKENKDAEN